MCLFGKTSTIEKSPCRFISIAQIKFLFYLFLKFILDDIYLDSFLLRGCDLSYFIFFAKNTASENFHRLNRMCTGKVSSHNEMETDCSCITVLTCKRVCATLAWHWIADRLRERSLFILFYVSYMNPCTNSILSQ